IERLLVNGGIAADLCEEAESHSGVQVDQPVRCPLAGRIGKEAELAAQGLEQMDVDLEQAISTQAALALHVQDPLLAFTQAAAAAATDTAADFGRAQLFDDVAARIRPLFWHDIVEAIGAWR